MAVLQPPMPDQLKEAVQGKVVLVTGAASGIGLATAKLLAASNAEIIGVDMGSEERLSKAAAEIGHGAVCYPCDVSSWEQQLELFKRIVQQFGLIDAAFLNAGTHKEMITVSGGHDAEAADKLVECNYLADEEDGTGALRQPSQSVFQVNFMGVLYGIKLAAHHMKKQKHGGRIIATVSANAYLAIPSSPQYDASKHAVLGLVRSTSQRAELLDSNISVSALCPSMTRTPMTDVVATERLQGIKASEPKDVAQAVAWLVSNPRGEVNGKAVMVKGEELREVEDSYRGWMYPLFAG